MAEAGWGGDEAGDKTIEISTHPLVHKLLDGQEPPLSSGALVGYFGPSKKPGHVRLYLSLDFSDYAEIPSHRILLTQPATPDDKDGPTKVLIAGDAELELIHIASTTLAAAFLQGGITRANLPAAEGDTDYAPGSYPIKAGENTNGAFFVKTIPPTPWLCPMAGLPTTVFHPATHTKPPCC